MTGLGGWGVPTLVFGGRQALFGPVLIEPADLRAIATAFQPYLKARDWVTIQKETP